MRVIQMTLTAAVVLVVASSLGCSKNSSAPTAPPDSSPSCSLSTMSLDFGTVAIGGNADRSFTVKNVGGDTLTGSASTTSPGFATVGSASYRLATNQSATITVRFSPAEGRSYSGSIALGNQACGSVALAGVGQTTDPVCRVSPTALFFGAVVPGVCDYSERTFTIQNVGGGILSGTVSSPCPAFEIVGRTTYSLATGMRDTFTVRFSPPSFGSYSCGIVTGCDTVTCTGTTTSRVACGTFVPTTLDFGTVAIGQTVTQTLTLTGGSAAPFNLAWAGTRGVCSDFSGFLPYLGIDAGQVLQFSIRFAPTGEGPQTCAMQARCRTLIGDGEYHPFACVVAIGTGQVAPGVPVCELSSTRLEFGIVAVGSSADRTVTVTNTGGGVLNGSIGPCDPFSIVGDPSFSLAGGQSKVLTVRFSPPQAGHAYSCYLHLADPLCPWVQAEGEGR